MKIHKTRSLSLDKVGRFRWTHAFTLKGTGLNLTSHIRMPRSWSVRRIYLFITLALLGAATLFPDRPVAQSNVLVINSVTVDPPTIHMLGVQMLISGDANRNAKVEVRYRSLNMGGAWRTGPPLFRVLPLSSPPWPQPVPDQFAGTIFDLLPNTMYEIELHATDADGSVNVTIIRTGQTRPIPKQEPDNPVIINATPATFQTKLDSAQPGHVILLANGTYTGQFHMYANPDGTGHGNGTAANPIVIRGQSATGVVLDGGGCDPCNVLEIYGSYVHVENLTLQNAQRALKFQGDLVNLDNVMHDNVARRLVIRNVIHGIGTNGGNQLDFYIADNDIVGRLVWPWVFDTNPPASQHWDDDGIVVYGDGHVVCHNKIKGFGDPMISKKVLARSIDFYGNDILDSFDGTELDFGGGNVRAIHNRFTNVGVGVSLQPIYGGPAYVLRNVFLNFKEEQIKLKGTNGEPSGVLIYHNTFVSPVRALNLQAAITGHNFFVMNNLFVGPRAPVGQVVEWTEGIDGGKFDFNGYFPNGGFQFDDQSFTDFADLQASGLYEGGGTLLTEPIFADGFVGPTGDGHDYQLPANFALASGSNAINRGTVLPGINQPYAGALPDLGAIEPGCTPTYGPRNPGEENVVALVNCGTPPSTTLPSPWFNQDIGSVGVAGSASYSSGTFTVKGSGADIWGTADEFHYVYQSLNGDGQIIARIASVQNTHQFAKAGLMIREELTAGSPHVILDLKPGGGLEFMSRSTTGGTTSVVTSGTAAIPYWLKLVRSGNTFTASQSSDGINWIAVGSGTTVNMATNVKIGLAVTSHNDSVLNTSTFSNVSVTSMPPTDFWTDLVDVTVNSTNGLTKDNDGTAGWNAGAYSVQTLTGDGYVEFSTGEVSMGKVLGLSTNVAGQNFTGISYAISLGAGNQARIYENGSQKGLFSGPYLTTDRYRVSIEGGLVKYYKNGMVYEAYTGSVPLTHSLRVDTSLYNPGATITNPVISGAWGN